MEKEKMLEKIYEVIADKTLSFGCDVMIKRESVLKSHGKYYWGKEKIIGWRHGLKSGPLLWCGEYIDIKKTTKYKIIGHPVMIGDVFDWIEEHFKLNIEEFDDLEKLFISWKKLRKPIDDQSDECISFIYGLI